ncbi:hypothetical protein M413DRAFT_32833 [Hebeloma cylindrosporum]|uniref:Uncharacterized protein n=1 Tax=Hebeloma cylindrosporum TaxID=76867 RepID=A0A0C3BDY6_HEBCY|nr:hypothetical protein M413DRAFT_32833 [Hebeloma cylindrosporum h7]
MDLESARRLRDILDQNGARNEGRRWGIWGSTGSAGGSRPIPVAREGSEPRHLFLIIVDLDEVDLICFFDALKYNCPVWDLSQRHPIDDTRRSRQPIMLVGRETIDDQTPGWNIGQVD